MHLSPKVIACYCLYAQMFIFKPMCSFHTNASKLDLGQCVGLPNSTTSNIQKPDPWTFRLHVESIWKFVLQMCSWACCSPGLESQNSERWFLSSPCSKSPVTSPLATLNSDAFLKRPTNHCSLTYLSLSENRFLLD